MMNIHYFNPNVTKINLYTKKKKQLKKNETKRSSANNLSIGFIPDLLRFSIDR